MSLFFFFCCAAWYRKPPCNSSHGTLWSGCTRRLEVITGLSTVAEACTARCFTPLPAAVIYYTVTVHSNTVMQPQVPEQHHCCCDPLTMKLDHSSAQVSVRSQNAGLSTHVEGYSKKTNTLSFFHLKMTENLFFTLQPFAQCWLTVALWGVHPQAATSSWERATLYDKHFTHQHQHLWRRKIGAFSIWQRCQMRWDQRRKDVRCGKRMVCKSGHQMSKMGLQGALCWELGSSLTSCKTTSSEI